MTRITVGVVSVHVFKRKSVEAGGSQLLVSEVRLCLRCRLELLPLCPQVPFFWSGGPESCSHAAHPLPAPHLVLSHYPAQDGPFSSRPWWPSLLQGLVLPRGCCALCGLLPDCPPPPHSWLCGFRRPCSPFRGDLVPLSRHSTAATCSPFPSCLRPGGYPHGQFMHQKQSTRSRNSCGGSLCW